MPTVLTELELTIFTIYIIHLEAELILQNSEAPQIEHCP